MTIKSQELSALTLIASGVAADQLESQLTEPLGPDALLVKDFLLNPVRQPATPDELEAKDTADGIRNWFSRQLAESEQVRPSYDLSSRPDYEQLMSE